MGLRSDDPRLDDLALAELTYREHGATRDELPAGYDHAYRDALLGTGRSVFDKAAAGLLGWQMHRGAGMSVRVSEPVAAPGAVIAMRVGWGPLSLVAPCRVVYRIEQPDARGFAYGTLPGHPERGEEAFVVHLEPGGDVRLSIKAFSRPATVLARAGGPVTRKVQAVFTDRYVRALRRISRN